MIIPLCNFLDVFTEKQIPNHKLDLMHKSLQSVYNNVHLKLANLVQLLRRPLAYLHIKPVLGVFLRFVLTRGFRKYLIKVGSSSVNTDCQMTPQGPEMFKNPYFQILIFLIKWLFWASNKKINKQQYIKSFWRVRNHQPTLWPPKNLLF